jgi:hypothetical protein
MAVADLVITLKGSWLTKLKTAWGLICAIAVLIFNEETTITLEGIEISRAEKRH